ncbi:MAG TPA: hypothetical protein VG294_13870 [Solirubrobacteraceae bacterium]|jgi:hypothetical protein|nr:hypothetical protein [Solirubrobacteraceae bacterium]
MEENDPDKLARKRERETDELEQRSDSLEREISDVRQDWQRKRQDPDIPGALPPEDEQG